MTHEPAPALLQEVPAEVRFVLGDCHYNTPELHENSEQAERLLVTKHDGHYLHTNEEAKYGGSFIGSVPLPWKTFMSISRASLKGMDKFPTCGLIATQRFALGAIFVYQFALTSPLCA